MTKEEMAEHVLASAADTQFVLLEIATAGEWLGFAALAIHDTLHKKGFAQAVISYAHRALS